MIRYSARGAVWIIVYLLFILGPLFALRLGSKLAELLSIALDASYTHMYPPGTRRHIKAAFKLGATMEEFMEVLKLCVIQGVQAFNLGIPILDEELERTTASQSVA